MKLTQILHLASLGDPARSALNGVRIEKTQAVVTDGHAALAVAFDGPDAPILITPSVARQLKATLGKHGTGEIVGTEVRSGGVVIPTAASDMYPGYERMFETTEYQAEVYINPVLLSSICLAMRRLMEERGVEPIIKLRIPTDRCDPVRLEAYAASDVPMVALVMPCEGQIEVRGLPGDTPEEGDHS